MKFIKKTVLIVIILLIGVIVSFEIFLFSFYDKDSKYSQIDRCLDSSGCWDEVDSICRVREPNAQKLCNRKQIGGATHDQRVLKTIHDTTSN